MGSSYRQLFVLAWPVALARSAQAAIGFADAAMIAGLGKEALAATTTGALDAMAMFMLPMGLVFIVQSFAAQLRGQGDLAGARRYLWYGLLVSAIAQVVGIAAIPLVGPILGLTDFTPGVQALMTDYISIRLLGTGAVVATEAIANWYGGLGDTRLSLLASLVAMVSNIALNWVFIYGNLGAPALGVQGAAIASTIAVFLGLFSVVSVYASGWLPGTAARVPTGPLALRRAEFARFIRFGFPSGLNWFLEFAAFLVFVNVVFAGLGTLAVATLMTVIQVNTVSFMPAFGLASAGAILVGQAIGVRRHDDVPAIVKRTGVVCAVWQGLVGLTYVAIPGAIMATFAETDEVAVDELVVLGTTLLAISAAWQLFDALCNTLTEALRAAGDTAWVLLARIVLSWVLWLPLSLYVVRVRGGGPVEATACMAVYFLGLSAIILLRFRSGAWRRIDLTGHTPTH